MSFRAISLAVYGAALAVGVLADDSTTNTTSIAPAATTVSSSSTAAGAALFEDETVQLTDSVIASLNETISNASTVALFDFASNDSDTASKRSTSSCKVFPGDSAWPSTTIWKLFDLLLGGALIKTVPSAASCYDNWGVYNEAECDYVTTEWTDSYFHAADPTSVMWPLYQGRTCLPTSEASDNCTLGGYPIYAINVTNVAQIQLAVNFARNTNIRLVIKNTGHDFNGKSAGAGALSIWTHHLKKIEYLPKYSSSSYSGKALKLGAGVQAFEVYAAADKYGVTAVGGEGRTVGVAGGFLAGGGHSPLSSIYGMAADQIVAIEVVLADGRFVTATDTVNSDLFWALRGGGGATFGIVTSVVVKAYPKIGVTASRFTFTTGGSVTADDFWQAMRSYLTYFPTWAAAGTYSYFWIIPLGNDSYEFEMAPFFGPNLTISGFNSLMSGWFAELDSLGITYDPNATYYDNFYDAWWDNFPLETVGISYLKTASRLFPKANFENETLFNETFAAIRNTTEYGHSFLSFNIAAPLKSTNTANSVNPAWRKTVLHAITSTTWDEDASIAEIQAASDELTYGVMDQWRATCPESGAYMSEADISEPNFQQAFYGSNYERLYSLKQTYDPRSVFYAPTAVGSENWTVKSVDGLPDQNGRLCKA